MRKLIALASLGVGAVLALSAPAMAASGSAFVGTWVLDVAKSKADPGPLPQSDKLVTSDAGNGMLKTVEDGVDAGGKTFHMEVTYSLDGKPATATMTPAASDGDNGFAVTLVNAKSMKVVPLKDGQPLTQTLMLTISADGKTQTVSVTGTTRDGKPISETDIYSKS